MPGRFFSPSRGSYPLATGLPELAISTDDAIQQTQTLGHVAPQDPDPPGWLPPASDRLDPPPQVRVPPADPQSRPLVRTVSGLAGELPRSMAL